ncbi:HNH endonuclease [Nostoc sp. DSM 114167]|uniref:HNH endonuclease n=1 Tax=Nostoc sp. DSM 114167 TaxID=3439050 RepID=UPI004045770F
MQEFNQLRDAHERWTHGTGKAKFNQMLKKRKKVILKDFDGVAAYQKIEPQDHGIKKALLKRPLLADTSVILQKLIVEILHTTTEENVKELILTAMKQIQWETELFTKQLERHIVEAKIKDYRKLTEAERVKIKQRDGYACLCCGANIESKLEIRYIKPLRLGGKISIENSQTLCVICDKYKGNNEIDFRCNTTKLRLPKNIDLSFISEKSNSIRTLTRVVNSFYNCKAVYKIKVNWKIFTCTYNIYLYPDNNPEWLLQHKAELFNFSRIKFGCYIHNIEVITIDKCSERNDY